MKKSMKKALAVLMVALLCVGVYAPVASAATQPVIIHVQDGEGWGKMNVYNWGDGGETAGVWPGAEMAADTVDGWYTYTIDTEVDLNLVLSAAGTPQSNNVDPIKPDAGEVWIVIGGEGEANELSGGATAATTLYLEAQEGFPTTAVAEETADAAVAETTEAAADVPKTGESVTLLVTLSALAIASAIGAASLKKKTGNCEQ